MYPEEGKNFIKFQAHDKQIMRELIGFYDFESILKPAHMKDARCSNCSEFTCKCTESSTQVTHYHAGIMYSLIIVDLDSNLILEKKEFCKDGGTLASSYKILFHTLLLYNIFQMPESK